MTNDWRRYAALHPGAGHTVVGDLRVLAGVDGPDTQARDILVLLPRAAETARRRYPVVYMLDGQNLFDAATSFAGEWQVDETMAALATDGIDAIVVGIPNGRERRFSEYTPFATAVRPFGQPTGGGAAHIRYVADIVRPLVDARFPTRGEAAATAIIGSSLGGLLAAYAGAARPDVFGLVGAMSPALGFKQRDPLFAVIASAPRPARAYVDVGTAESGEGAAARLRSGAWVVAARRLLDAYAARGLREGADLQLVVEDGAPHHESAWARRLPDALRFLLGQRP